MDTILMNQQALFERIKTIRVNYDKTGVDRRTFGYVSKKVETLDAIWLAFCENDMELRNHPQYHDTDYAKKHIFDICEEEYSRIGGDFADRIQELKPRPDPIQPQNPAPEHNPNPIPIANQNPHPQPRIRLPDITLPTFAGDYASWSAFHDMFVSLIHSNSTLSDVQKLHYLKCNLRDKAADFLRHTPITSENYATAWASLNTRYANKKVLVETQLKALMNQPSISSDSAGSIRHMLDTTQESINALRALEIDVATWDPILLFTLVQKLSKESHAAWELNQEGVVELPSYANFIRFLEHRFRMLESLDARSSSTSAVAKASARNVKSHATISSAGSKSACILCSGQHYVRSCPKLLPLSVSEKRNLLKQHRICFNCLVPGHLVPECKNHMNCQLCNKRHHTLLHEATAASSSSTSVQQPPLPRSPPTAQIASTSQSVTPSNSNNVSIVSNIASPTSTLPSSPLSSSPANVLLATAIVHAVSTTGAIISLRALIDQGSQVTLLTENSSQLLRLKSHTTDWTLSGIGNTSAGRIRNVVHFQIRSPHRNDFALNLNACVIKTVTGILPPIRCSIDTWPHISNIVLADPSYNQPGPIDLLLGADAYPHIIQEGLLRGPPGAPIAQSTVFGWILSGSAVPSPERYDNVQSHLITLHTCIDIDSRLKTFWEIDDIPFSESIYTEEELQCEEHYTTNHSKTADGRYVVRLPMRENAQFGESRPTAHRRLLQLERRLSTNQALRNSYNDFMREYISLGHMQLSETSTTPQHRRYYIPHHAVIKESSSTTKVRVVFDASSKTTNGVALNDMMLIGPKIQDDLSVILLRWRKYPFAFTADVEKMYRQILVHPADHHLQHILWRESPDQPIAEYALQTVTYGTSCAPHLAVRTLRQLAIDQAETFPVAAKIAREDFYVDDLMSGAYTASDALSIRRELCDLMSAGRLKLRKWVSNYAALLDEINSSDRELQHPLNIEINNTVTALGIIWHPASDTFHFKLNLPDVLVPFTKRNVLSDISKLFDPLGWLAPIIIRSKMLMQQLWLQGVSWDDTLPNNITKLWSSQRADLCNVDQISIARWMQHRDTEIELHGFSDASNHAYAAAIYARMRQDDGRYHTTLLTAKTRVAPLKQVSIPKLELCGAVLVAELLQKTKNQLRIDNVCLYAWTDSSIVLHWLHSQPSRWKTFVANRVSTIQQLVPMSCWRHVPTSDNPADCASRGIDAKTLQSFDLWWRGPIWLKNSPDTWPNFKHKPRQDDINEQERHIINNMSTSSCTAPSFAMTLLGQYDSLDRLLRVFSYCKRFIDNIRKRPRIYLPITAAEKHTALQFFVISSQRSAFYHEVQILSKQTALSSTSKLLPLNPILDQNGILRVGGRLENAHLSYDEKHPIILSPQCHLTSLIIRKHHFATMHGGATLVSGLIRKQFWIVNARNIVRLHIHRCITCHRYKAASASQLMGNLPQPRVNITRAFTHTGVDYAGPIDLRMSKGRGNASYKGYVSLFVCLCTKAVHIEAVSDLTSTAFIAAYRRFVARRGLPAHVYSDNGTNFVGAVNILRKQYDSLLQVKADIINVAAHANSEWHFIPPASPHFGGLWEAGVKSVKYHLKRSIGNARLTYEEMSTLLAQIEACLNSRPLTALTSDPDDLNVLTPGHFLTGNALLAVPDSSTEPRNISSLTRWQLVQRLYQEISTRWQTEYLSRLQQRPKWTKSSPNLQVNDLVLLKESSHPPSQWPLARITKTHPGDDGLVRVVTVRTQSSEFKRCVTKICPLPQ